MSEYVPPSNVISRTGAGVVGGIAGGVVLGIILQIMGFMPQFASLFGHSTTGWAWIAQLTVAAAAGAASASWPAGRSATSSCPPAGSASSTACCSAWCSCSSVLPLASGDTLFTPGRPGDAGHRRVRPVRGHRRRDLRDRRPAPPVLRVRGPAADLRLHHPGQPAPAAQARQRLTLPVPPAGGAVPRPHRPPPFPHGAGGGQSTVDPFDPVGYPAPMVNAADYARRVRGLHRGARHRARRRRVGGAVLHCGVRRRRPDAATNVVAAATVVPDSAGWPAGRPNSGSPPRAAARPAPPSPRPALFRSCSCSDRP